MDGIARMNIDSYFLEFVCKADEVNVIWNQYLTLILLKTQLVIAVVDHKTPLTCIQQVSSQSLGVRKSASAASAESGSGCQL